MMENPFENPLYLPLSQGGLNVNRENPLVKGGNEGGFETRRSDLKPEVRKYADKMYARLQEIYKKFGATDAAGVLANAKARKGPKLEKKDVEEMNGLLNLLDEALTKNKIPPPELPTLELLQETIDKINDQVAPLRVMGLASWSDYRVENGKLNGVVTLSDSCRCPVVAGKLVREIPDGHGLPVEIKDCEGVEIIDGKLNGTFYVEDFEKSPVIDGRFYPDGYPLRHGQAAVSEVTNVNGKLNCMRYDEHWRHWYPVIDGQAIRKIKDASGTERSIVNGCRVRNIDGKLNCNATLDDKRSLPIIDGVLREEVVDGQGVRHKITGCEYDIRNVDGKLNGSVYIENDRGVPVIDDVIVDTIQDKEGTEYRIMSSVDIENIDGKLNGRLGLEGENRFKNKLMVPVIDGRMIESLVDESGKQRLIVKCFMAKNVRGSLTACVELTDGNNYPVISGKLVQSIEGRPIKIKWDERFSDAGGLYSGKVFMRDTGEEKRVLLGKFLID